MTIPQTQTFEKLPRSKSARINREIQRDLEQAETVKNSLVLLVIVAAVVIAGWLIFSSLA